MRSKSIPREVQKQCVLGLARGLKHASSGLSFDEKGYVATPEANLVPGLQLADFEADLRAGAGAELDGKFRAAHSSCALAINCFAPFRAGRMPLSIGRHQALKIIGFEQKVSTGLSRAQPPNLDLLAMGPDGLVALESKCTEYLSPKVAKFSDRYKDCITDRHPEGQPWFNEMLRLMDARGVGYQFLDAAQLVKHALGLIHRGEKSTLVYLYWEPIDHPQSEIFRKHREEADEFGKRVAGANPSFEAMTYAELWDAWDKSGHHELATHVRNLRSRYEVPAWSWEGVSWVNGRLTNSGLLADDD